MLFQLVKPVYAACAPGQAGGTDLSECLFLNPDGTTVASEFTSFADIVNLLVSNLFIISGIILFLLVFYAGFKMATGDTKAKDEARTMLTTGVTGFIVMFVAYWVIQIIELVVKTEILF